MADGDTITVCKVAPAGALQARNGKKGILFFWRYSQGTTSKRLSIGPYDATPGHVNKHTPTVAGYSIAAAIKAAEAMAVQHTTAKAAGGGMGEILEQQKQAKAEAKAQQEAAALAVKAAADATEAAAKYTLKALILAYCDHLQSLGRTSHKDARSIFNLHVIDAWPQLAVAPAKSITEEQVADMMRRLHEAGKGRTANKLRSYTRAAYQTAKAAKSKPSIPVHFKAYGITHNPAAETSPDESANKADKNPLTLQELRNYWKQIKDAPGHRAAVLRFVLLTAGNRPEQVFRLKTKDIDLTSTPPMVTIFDPKGRPGKPARIHALPLIPAAVETLEALKPQGEFALSTDGGRTHITAGSTYGAWSKAAAQAVGIVGFTPKRIRSTVETVLAPKSMGVSKEIRGRLQSHGISGVQAGHYDAYDYLQEKYDAMQTFYQILTTDGSAKILPMLSPQESGQVLQLVKSA
ncbi:integrase [Acidovorax sp.]|uniref:tyrosine-type recombinase/integrase n=2 Tax=Acidovorax TaxID=12916 RepID=UPI00262D7E19|nr:integrase [Acidovorax sp.]